jgi:iron complex transport system substrate-binding protein
MKAIQRVLPVLLALSLLLSGLMVQAQEANLLADCVTDYDAETDYFPDKLTVDYSIGWDVEYYNNYKVINMTSPWPGAGPDDAFQYVLVQCGTPAPEGYDDALVIEVPTGDIIALSTTYLPAIVDLGLVDKLIGMDSNLYVNSPEVIERIEAGDVIEVGSGSTINVEAVLDAEPSIVLAYGSGTPEYDAHPALLEAGVFVAIATDYVENHPLGRAEWLKFIALFYNAEAEANAIFDDRVSVYHELAALTADIPEEDRPTILWSSNSSWTNAWSVPGRQSYVGQLLADAGVNYVLQDAEEVLDNDTSAPFDFEVVYDAGLDADYWLPDSYGITSLDDLLASDERYGDFAAFQSGEVYLNDSIVNENGGNDYYESGASNPQVILGDLIAIFYPDLLPDYAPYYFRQADGS